MSIPWIGARLDISAEKWLRGGVRPPDVPTGIVLSPRDAAARLYWRGLQGEGVQTLYRVDDGPPTLIETLVHGKYTIRGLTNGATHKVELMISSPQGDSAWSSPVYVTPVAETVYGSVVIRSRHTLFGFVARLDLASLPSELWDEVDRVGGTIRLYDDQDDEVPMDVVWADLAGRSGLVFYKVNVNYGATILRVRVVSDGWPDPYGPNGREVVWNAYLRVYIHDWFDRTGKGAISAVSPSGLPAAGEPLVSSSATPRWFVTPAAHTRQYSVGFNVKPSTVTVDHYAASYGRTDSLFRVQHGSAGDGLKPFGIVSYPFKRLYEPSVVNVAGVKFRHNAVVITGSTRTTAYRDGIPVGRAYAQTTDTRSSASEPSTIAVGAVDPAGASALRGELEWFYFTTVALSDEWVEAENRSWNDPASFASVHLGAPPYEVQHLWWDGAQKRDAFLKGYWDGSKVKPAQLLGWWDGVVVRDVRATSIPPPPPPREVYEVGTSPPIPFAWDITERTVTSPPGVRPGDVILCAFVLRADDLGTPLEVVPPPGWFALGNSDYSYSPAPGSSGENVLLRSFVMAYRVTEGSPSTHRFTFPWDPAFPSGMVGETFTSAWRNVGDLDPAQSVYGTNVSGAYVTRGNPIPGTVAKGSRLVVSTHTIWINRFSDEYAVAVTAHPALGIPHDYVQSGGDDRNWGLHVWPVQATVSDLTVPVIQTHTSNVDDVFVAVVLPYDG